MVTSKKIETLKTEVQQPLNSHMQGQYHHFRKSYDSRGGHKIYTARPGAFLDFFYICDQRWGKIPDYSTLQSNLSQQEYQRAMPVFKWLVKTGHIQADEKLYESILIQCAIQETLAKFGKEPPLALQSYLNYLNEKFNHHDILQKSIRAFLQPPMYLYHKFGLNGSQTPSQGQIERYLNEHQGSHSIICTFVKFLNKFHSANLVCKMIKKKKPVTPNPKGGYEFVDDKSRKLAESALIELGRVDKPLDDDQKISWINNGIRYFHRHKIDIQSLKEVVIKNSRESGKLMVIEHYETSFPLPKFLN